MLLSMLLLGGLTGAFASGVNVLLHDGDMTSGECWTYMLGGAFGGVLAGSHLNPTALSPRDILLIALCGFAMAHVAHRLVTAKKP